MELIRTGHALFLKILNMSVSACWIILAAMLLRIILKKAPKWISCTLWGIVAVRLICPFSIEAPISMLPSSRPVDTDYFVTKLYADTGVKQVDKVVNEYISSHYSDGVPIATIKPTFNLVDFISIVWVIGVAALLIYAVLSYFHLYKYVSDAAVLRDNIKLSKNIKSPFILGIVHPVIYVPAGISDNALDYVISHENAHIRRKDYLWKLIGYLMLSIHWFNPLIWISYALFCKDIELACDEKAVCNMDDISKAEYIQTLLDCSAPRSPQNACPIAFAEVGVKERVKAITDYKKPAFWLIAVAVILCAVLAVCFLTVPPTYGSLRTHARELGIGEPIDRNQDLTYDDCRKYMAIDTILEYYSAAKEHWYQNCEIDGTVIYDREIEWHRKDNSAEADYLNIEETYLKDEKNECEHSEVYYNIADQYILDYLNINIDFAQYPKKLEQTVERGYVKVVFDMGPVAICDRKYNYEKDESYDKWIESCVHYIEGFSEIIEFYLDPTSSLLLKERFYDYQDGQLIRSGGSDQLFIK